MAADFFPQSSFKFNGNNVKHEINWKPTIWNGHVTCVEFLFIFHHPEQNLIISGAALRMVVLDALYRSGVLYKNLCGGKRRF